MLLRSTLQLENSASVQQKLTLLTDTGGSSVEVLSNMFSRGLSKLLNDIRQDPRLIRKKHVFNSHAAVPLICGIVCQFVGGDAEL